MAETKIEITVAPEAERIGNSLVSRYHGHLEGVGILYLLTTQTLRDGANIASGKVTRLSPKERFMLSGSTREGDEFAIWLDRDQWGALSQADRTALVDHELMHLQLDEPDDEDEPQRIVIVGHDVQAFAEEVRRYGPWTEGLRDMAQQLRLWDADDEAKDERDAGGDTVTLSTKDRSVTVTADQFHRAANAAARFATSSAQ